MPAALTILLLFNAGVIFGILITLLLIRRVDHQLIDQALGTTGIRRSEFNAVVTRLKAVERE